jgi:hypothetical protein
MASYVSRADPVDVAWPLWNALRILNPSHMLGGSVAVELAESVTVRTEPNGK